MKEYVLIIDFEVLSHGAYLYTICGNATNTWEVDTSQQFLGSIAHDQMLMVWIHLPLFVICLYDVVKPVENLVNIIIVGWFI